MYLIERLCAVAMSVVNIVSLSPLQKVMDNQKPPLVPSEAGVHWHTEIAPPGPIFDAPGAPADHPFQCQYPAMVGWEFCSTPTNRECWLRRTSDGKQYDIHTDYEDDAPLGITRNYALELSDGWWDADGLNFTAAKLFNNTYPGPWIQACWGDTLSIKVTNKLEYNGTSVHWHGLRQYHTNNMDGVNGVTQCPIAPQDYMIYEFKISQYGSSWYHSHYSVQYADGAAGPMTLHGPSSAEWDEAISPPLIVTDWDHNSAWLAVLEGPAAPDILLNGRGNIIKFSGTPNTTTIPNSYSITFAKPQSGIPNKKYLLRIINTSFLRAYAISIDNHKLQIVGADYVPIHPYYNTSVHIGIGQRYHVIVEADPIAYNSTSSLPTDGNYWIRIYQIACTGTVNNPPGYETIGILRYDVSSTADPSSQPWQSVSQDCTDETYTSLHPIVPWQVLDPGDLTSGEQFDLENHPNAPSPEFPLATWAMDLAPEFIPLRVDYLNLTFFHLDNTGSWNPEYRIIPEPLAGKDWIYLAIIGPSANIGAHPIHLHGHDFAILEQAYTKTFNTSTLALKLDNPPRRDVVLVPRDGYVVMAFKADNPGAWLVHCHIAFHITQGLGMQVLERQSDANKLWPKGSLAQKEAGRICGNWEAWYDNQSHWAVPPATCSYADKAFCFQDDSGV